MLGIKQAMKAGVNTVLRMLARLCSPAGILGCRFQGHTSKLNLILYLEKESANW